MVVDRAAEFSVSTEGTFTFRSITIRAFRLKDRFCNKSFVRNGATFDSFQFAGVWYKWKWLTASLTASIAIGNRAVRVERLDVQFCCREIALLDPKQ